MVFLVSPLAFAATHVKSKSALCIVAPVTIKREPTGLPAASRISWDFVFPRKSSVKKKQLYRKLYTIVEYPLDHCHSYIQLRNTPYWQIQVPGKVIIKLSLYQKVFLSTTWQHREPNLDNRALAPCVELTSYQNITTRKLREPTRIMWCIWHLAPLLSRYSE